SVRTLPLPPRSPLQLSALASSVKVVPDLLLVKAVDGRFGLYDSMKFSLFQFLPEAPCRLLPPSSRRWCCLPPRLAALRQPLTRRGTRARPATPRARRAPA